MKLRLRQLTSFNGVALDTANAIYSTKVDYEGLEAVSRTVTTPFGTEIDLDGNYAAPVKRLPIRAYLLIDAAYPAIADAVFNEISGLVGLSAPLKGKAHGGATVTCTARLVNMSGTLDAPWYTNRRSWQKFVLVFRQKTDWA